MSSKNLKLNQQIPKIKRSVTTENSLMLDSSDTNTTCSRKFRNECYCCGLYNKPSLPFKPISSIKVGTSINGSSTPPEESTHSMDIKHLAHTLNYSPDSKFLKTLNKEADQIYNCSYCEDKIPKSLKFTPQRELLENIHDEEQNKLDEIIRECHTCSSVGKEEHTFQESDPLYNLDSMYGSNYSRFQTYNTVSELVTIPSNTEISHTNVSNNFSKQNEEHVFEIDKNWLESECSYEVPRIKKLLNSRKSWALRYQTFCNTLK